MRKITDLPGAFARLAEAMPLYLPVREDGVTNFSRWQADAEFELAEQPVMSAKGFFLPPSENLYHTRRNADTYAVVPQNLHTAPFALFGVRGCDAAGLEILDSVFLADAADKFYEARRKAACIITIGCAKPAKTCFCQTFGINPAQPGGDVTAWLADGGLYWQSHTEKGRELTEILGDLTAPAEYTPEAAEMPTMPLPAQSLELFNHPAWDTLHRACIACGTCTFLCPTCQCYDIADFDAARHIACHRAWDSCMYAEFTQMAHGNPRPTHKERFRQRFMHKLVYHPQNHGGTCGCTGCGRCVSKCPVNLNIAKVIRALEVPTNG